MERREHPRAPLAVPIRMNVGNTHRFALQHSRDLSTGGIFVQTRRRFEEGAEVLFPSAAPNDPRQGSGGSLHARR